MSDMLASTTLGRDELERRWAIVLPHRDRALRVARARTENAAEAEDIASETLIRVVTVAGLREDTVAGLVSTVAIRLAVDLHRRESTGRRLEARSRGGLVLPGVDEAIVDLGEAGWLHGVVNDLLPLEREVLLHRAAGHSNSSAAEALGLTYKSVASAYTRARASVKNAWRATLGVIIWITAGIRRATTRAQPAVKAASLAVVALAVAILQGAGSGPAHRATIRTARTSAPGTARKAGTRLATAMASRRSAPLPPAAEGGTSPPPESARIIVDSGPVGDPRLVQAAARVTVRHEDETTLQTLQRCVHKGLDVGIYRVDCRD